MPKSALSTWLQGRLKGSKAKKQSVVPLPCLPSPRPRAVTPTPSSESITLLQQQLSGFFTKLPADIRRNILIAAFGKRALHMNLALDYALPLFPGDESGLPSEGPRPRHIGAYEREPFDPRNKPKVWRWSGNVSGLQSSRNGMVGSCDKQKPEECLIGIMGFLLSCKQAYMEGIDVLYGTNCISISSNALMLNLPNLILPQRLASITSLELLVEAKVTYLEKNYSDISFSHAGPVLVNIATHCRALRRLRLSMRSSVSTHHADILEVPVLTTIDGFFLSMPQLIEMTVELPKVAFEALEDTASRQPAQHPLEKRDAIGNLFWSSPWRCFDGGEDDPETQLRSVGNYPQPPLQLPTPENEHLRIPSLGYWIVESNDGRPCP